ncbi:DUF3380 domain-containing protein [Polymorphobacter arshaanensis]|uniref:DUF3380 domain-containing protein n=1 Tax=Glacieibacterium arshaanense TaxID=2511025 RepID=A0A4Y9ENT0_9SPHN|nr:N-acetylmuramidase family protein [Polymorphobacter arshaanensis]TFU03708.1 DUF3380 domain-containing protein [Polymorphobacter arshaanensis]
MTDITSPVGRGQPNKATDVKLVQQLLNYCVKALALPPLAETGVLDPATEAAILAFQGKIVKLAKPDGVISPGRNTIKKLVSEARIVPPAPSPATPAPSPAEDAAANDAQIAAAAKLIGCEVAAVKAVTMTEVGIRGAFDALGRPMILFERHYFSRLTGHRFDAAHPDISNQKSGGYGKFSAQYAKLDRAIALDRHAALQSASWGAFQIMGANYAAAGFANVEDFVAAMKHSLGKQIEAFGNFVVANPRLRAAIKAKDWTTFARIYNGPGYAENHYDLKMKQNYELLSKRL